MSKVILIKTLRQILRGHHMTERLLHHLAWVAVVFCIAPILAAALAAFTGDLA